MKKKMEKKDRYEETYFISDSEEKETEKEVGTYGCF